MFSFHSIFQVDLAGTIVSPPVLSGYNGSPDTRFSRGTTRLMSWPDGERYLCPLHLLSFVSTLVFFSDWRRTVSSKFFDTQVPSFSTEEIVLPRHVRYVLSRLRCKGHSLLLSSYLSRIGRIENSSCSACRHSSQDTSHLILHCQLRTLLAAYSLATLCLYIISAPGPGKLPSFCGSMVFRHSPSLERGRVTTTILRD